MTTDNPKKKTSLSYTGVDRLSQNNIFMAKELFRKRNSILKGHIRYHLRLFFFSGLKKIVQVKTQWIGVT